MIGHTEGGSLLTAEKCGKCMTPSKQDWVYMAFGLNFGPTDMAVVDFRIIPFRSSTKNCSIHTCESDLVSQRFLTMELQGYFHTCYYLYSWWFLHISIHPQSTCTVPVSRPTSLTHPLHLRTRIIMHFDPHISHREGLAVSRCWERGGNRGPRDAEMLIVLGAYSLYLKHFKIPQSLGVEKPSRHHRSQPTCSRSVSAEDSVVSGTVLGRTILLDGVVWRLPGH